MTSYVTGEFKQHLATSNSRVEYPKLSIVEGLGIRVLSYFKRKPACEIRDLDRYAKEPNRWIGGALQQLLCNRTPISLVQIPNDG